jgi:hypothetical protein
MREKSIWGQTNHTQKFELRRNVILSNLDKRRTLAMVLRLKLPKIAVASNK